jgi:hypothetical protein
MRIKERTMNADDRRHIEAASGWVGLGLYAEAVSELEWVSGESKFCPESLEVCWRIYAHYGRWGECLNIGKELVAKAPDDAMNHIFLCEALHRLNRTEEAYFTLRGVLEQFDDCITCFYNLASYASRLGWNVVAKCWLETTFKLSEDSEFENYYRNLAREDDDLKSLWPEIAELGRVEEVRQARRWAW